MFVWVGLATVAMLFQALMIVTLRRMPSLHISLFAHFFLMASMAVLPELSRQWRGGPDHDATAGLAGRSGCCPHLPSCRIWRRFSSRANLMFVATAVRMVVSAAFQLSACTVADTAPGQSCAYLYPSWLPQLFIRGRRIARAQWHRLPVSASTQNVDERAELMAL